jgi:hypothetical protein
MTPGLCKRKRPGLIRVTGRFRTALPRKLFAHSLDALLKVVNGTAVLISRANGLRDSL